LTSLCEKKGEKHDGKVSLTLISLFRLK